MRSLFLISLVIYSITCFSQVSIDTNLSDHPLVPRQVEMKLLYKDVFEDSTYYWISLKIDMEKNGKQFMRLNDRIIRGKVTRLTYLLENDNNSKQNTGTLYRNFLETNGFQINFLSNMGRSFYRYRLVTNHPHSELIELVDTTSFNKSEFYSFYKKNSYDSIFVNYARSTIPMDSNYIFIDIIEKPVKDILKEEEISNAIKKEGKINIYGILFESGSANILEKSTVNLETLARFLINNQDLSVLIIGHTDNIGSTEYNLNLSLLRANAIKQSLIQDYKIKPERLKTKGLGETKPLMDNKTEEGRRLNRRVEIVKL
jgi:outer membrane protein OmpA-like peptidoglycan-associated protein